MKKQEYVDLGLPSRTKWATCNIGAENPEDYGYYFTWNEMIEFCWDVPDRVQTLELIKECTWEWTTQNGVNGYKVIGPNGNSIFFPAAGYRYESLCADGKEVLIRTNWMDKYNNGRIIYGDKTVIYHRGDATYIKLPCRKIKDLAV